MTDALLIIDQQQGIDHPKLGPRNNASAEAVMLDLLQLFRIRSWPVFHIKHRSSDKGSVFWPLQSGFAFKADFEPRENELVIEKKVPCAFINNSLGHQLQQLNISSLVIVGVATNNSVESTVRTAANLGFDVTVIAEACFTFDKVDFYGEQRSADQVHAMSLANLAGEYAQVISFADYKIASKIE